MRKRLSLKDNASEMRLFTRRTSILLAGAGLLLFLLVVRLFYLQVFQHDKYVTLANNNRITVLPLSPARGLIYDRENRVLAENIPSFRLEISPERIKNIPKTIEELKEIIPISQKDEDLFYKQLKQKRRFQGIPLRFQLSDEELARFALDNYRFPGVDAVAGLVRYYPYKELTSHVIGYMGRINEQELETIDKSNYRGTQQIGKNGFEKYYENLLHGTVGYQQVETNVRGRLVRVLERQPAQSGSDVQLTLDIELQQVAADALGERRGAVVAIEPKTGEVLVLLSQPGFDPNLFVVGIDQKSYVALRDSPDRPLYDRALRGLYPPGSTVKPIFALQGLITGIIDPEKRLFDPGWFKLPGGRHYYRNARREGHGWVNMFDALVVSNSTYFYQLAYNMGISRIGSILKTFDFGQKTGIDLPSESPGLVPSIEWKKQTLNQPWYPGETIIHGIGQGYTLATPLQLAHYTTILANRGERIMPHVLKSYKSEDGEQVDFRPAHREPILLGTEEQWDEIIAAMQGVTTLPQGTAFRAFRNAPYTVAGKTGTAQVVGIKQGEKYNAGNLDERLRDHTLFIGFAPIEDPQIAIAVMVENSTAGSLVARAVMDKYLEKKQQEIVDLSSE